MAMLVPVEELIPGFTLSRDVFGENGQMLLVREIELSPRYIEKLKALHVPSVLVNPSKEKEEAALPPRPVSLALENAARSQMREVFKIALDRKGVPTKLLAELASTVNDIVTSIFDTNCCVAGDIQTVRRHDDCTYEHSWLVFMSTLGLAKQALNLGILKQADSYYMNSTGIGALMHDIGKTGISAALLNKVEKLTDAEFAEIKSHSHLGCEELRKNGFYTPMMRAIALQHHQKWNGSGYGGEHAMKGDEIPFQIRLVTMADAFDALVSDRTYRKGITSGEAVIKLERDAGAHFDPRASDLFRATFPELARGAFLILKNGWVVNVSDTVMFGEKINGHVIGSIFGSEYEPAVADIAREDIIARGNSVRHLSDFVKGIRDETPIKILAKKPFDELLSNAFLK